MAKKKKSLKKNGQEFQPKYQFWAEQDFWADPQVCSGMSRKQRHFYRALLLVVAHVVNSRRVLVFDGCEHGC
jgi:hypothetical protein